MLAFIVWVLPALWPHLSLALYISLSYPSFLLHLKCIEHLLPCQLLPWLFPQHRWLCRCSHGFLTSVTQRIQGSPPLRGLWPPHQPLPLPTLPSSILCHLTLLSLSLNHLSVWNYIIRLFALHVIISFPLRQCNLKLVRVVIFYLTYLSPVPRAVPRMYSINSSWFNWLQQIHTDLEGIWVFTWKFCGSWRP